MAETSIKKREQAAGRKAARILQRNIRSEVRHLFETTEGNSQLLRSGVGSKMKYGRLQRLEIRGPHYLFKQHFGFEGVKSNGVRMQLISSTNLLNDAIHKDSALEDLATEMAKIRGDEVINIINF